MNNKRKKILKSNNKYTKCFLRIKKNPLIDFWYNLEDYENWLMDVSLDFGKVRCMSGASMRIEVLKDDIGPKFRKSRYTPKV